MGTTIVKQTPQETLDWTIDWTQRGLPTGITIASQVFTPDSADYTISDPEIVASGTKTAFTLTGGVPGSLGIRFYQFTNTVTLSDGEIMQETVTYECISSREI